MLCVFEGALGLLHVCAAVSTLQERCWDQSTRCNLVGLAWLAPMAPTDALFRFRDLERALLKGRIIQIIFSSLDPQCNAIF